MNEHRYFVLHNTGSDPGWTMLISENGRRPMLLDTAREKAESFVRQNPNAHALIVEAAYIVQTEYPPVRTRRFK